MTIYVKGFHTSAGITENYLLDWSFESINILFVTTFDNFDGNLYGQFCSNQWLNKRNQNTPSQSLSSDKNVQQNMIEIIIRM